MHHNGRRHDDATQTRPCIGGCGGSWSSVSDEGEDRSDLPTTRIAPRRMPQLQRLRRCQGLNGGPPPNAKYESYNAVSNGTLPSDGDPDNAIAGFTLGMQVQ